MKVCLVCAAILALLYCLAAVFRKQLSGKGGNPAQNSGKDGDDGSGCCGKHAVCEKRRLAEAANAGATYFDDEELDRFKGKTSDSFSDDETEEFRYVMYTMEQNEVREWLESLQVRGIELPDGLKDEARLLIE